MPAKITIYSVQPDGQLVPRGPVGDGPVYSFIDVVTFLAKRLPYSLPILRRLQLGPHGEGTLLVTTSLPLDEQVERVSDSEDVTAESLYTMAVIDRAGYPSTEIWPFSSLELCHGTAAHEKGPQRPETDPSSFVLPFSREVVKTATSQLLAVLSAIPVTNPSPPDLERFTTPGTSCCLAGNVHATIAALLAGADTIIRSAHEKSHCTPYGKYIFPLPSPGSPDSSALPEGLEWSTITPSDFADVMAANKIVRSPATIAKLHSAAIRDREMGKAVAFAFASNDGSVRTLHVDLAYRRRGLAKAVVLRLLKTGREKGVFGPAPTSGGALATGRDEEVAMAFTGIEGSNIGSIKTFEAIGGKWHWDVYWLWLDLNRVKNPLGLE